MSRTKPTAPRTATPARRNVRRATGALAALIVAIGIVVGGQSAWPAAATVVHHDGFSATVAGFRSWYGSYDMGALGIAWCIDHGIHAPDPAFRYAPTPVAEQTVATRTAMAWAVGRAGPAPDRVGAAAMMLVLHDLMGARYPTGRLDVDRLAPSALSGFGGQEGAVVTRARAIKADALAHAGLRGPYALTITAPPVDPQAAGTVTVRLTDAAGAPVGGIAVSLRAGGAGLAGVAPGGAASVVTAADGTAAVPFVAAIGTNRFDASATAPRLTLDAFASTTTPAQRVARPAVDTATAAVAFEAAPPTGTITITKAGDDEPYLPVGGARFEVRPEGTRTALATATVDGDGAAPPVAVPPGPYTVVEVSAPEGYGTAGPWPVVVTADADTAVVATDHARRGRITIGKLDARAGTPLAGAVVAVAFDGDHDGEFETDVGPVTTADEPVAIAELLPGDYLISETTAPPGYELDPQPVVVHVGPDATTEVTLRDTELPPPTTTTTTAPPAAPPTTTAPPPAAPPTTTASPPATLPHTGTDTTSLALLGFGLALTGAGCVGLGRRRTAHPARHGHL